MTEIGQKTVLLSREVEGFAPNRIQLAILMLYWQLVGDDILSVKEVDSIMKDGLGLRYASLGNDAFKH
jgi:L-gulonate 3-dehydrogenase